VDGSSSAISKNSPILSIFQYEALDRLATY
jgi:hypothetical protein